MTLTTGRLLLPYPVGTDSADVPRDVKALADRIEALTAWIRQADFAPGAGVHFPGDLKFTANPGVAPAGWLVCDGTSYNRADYPDLFAALGGAGSPWGLPDGTHFNVPNFKGRSPMGAGQNALAGAAIRSIGQLVGEEQHVLTAAELASHTHQFEDTQPFNSGAYTTAAGGQPTYYGTQNVVKNTLPNTPSGNGHNNVGPSAVVAVWIKT